ncbi:MAG: ABC transporter permease, partial [Candidatus Competibacterales bacterium]|nr:ABC transporter permease [Candidatus Competibacterales bacterium]
ALMLGLNAQPDTLAALRAQLGLDRPLAVRYLDWVGGLLQGDLGVSYTYGRPVSTLIAERVALSLPLALLAIVLSTLLAIPLGVLAAARRNRASDVAVMGFTQLGVAVPNFWFAILLILVFAVQLGWLPAGGFAGWDAGLLPALRSLTLPALALALPQAAILARVTRSAMLETLSEDYIRTARAKGLSRTRTLWRHALRNALIPVVTIMGLQFSFLLAGTIIIEQVFYLPGLGRLIFQAIAQRDLIVVESLVILLAATVVLVNFLVDLLYVVLDPRLRHRGGR